MCCPPLRCRDFYALNCVVAWQLSSGSCAESFDFGALPRRIVPFISANCGFCSAIARMELYPNSVLSLFVQT